MAVLYKKGPENNGQGVKIEIQFHATGIVSYPNDPEKQKELDEQNSKEK